MSENVHYKNEKLFTFICFYATVIMIILDHTLYAGDQNIHFPQNNLFHK